MAKEAIGPIEWVHYQVELTGITELLGGMPKTVKLIEGQMSSKEVRLKAKALGRDPEKIIAENIQAMGLEEGLDEATDEEKMSCGFRSHNGELALGAHQIPSMLLDAATTSKMSRKVPGLVDLLNRGFRAYQSGCEVHGVRCPFLRLGVQHPTGMEEWGMQVKDRAGSRAVLRRYDSLMPWSLAFDVEYIDTGVLSAQVWHNLWEVAQCQGLGAARPRGYGRFSVKCERD